jgi:LCP family protein required for cell wall assembly
MNQRLLPPRLWWLVIITSALFSLATLFLVVGVWFPVQIRIPIPGTQSVLSLGFQREKILLVMGVDASPNEYGARSDTMMLVRLDPSDKKVSAVSIPRDSKVFLNGGIDKINAAHAVGGPELAVRTVENAFGIPIDHYLVMNFRGVRECIDAIGGVDLYVEKPMRYRDRTAKLNINFEPGLQHLDGKKAEEYLRFRHDEYGDIGRIRRQQMFMSALARAVKNPWVITRLPSLVATGQKYLKTDMTADELLKLAAFTKDVDMSRIRVATMPGHPSNGAISYWIIDAVPAQAVLDRLILEAPPERFDSSPLRVGILYSKGLALALPDIQSKLEARGFEVSCRSRQRHMPTQMIEHTLRTTDEDSEKIRTMHKGLKNARLIFAPPGTTFERNLCGANEDYTLVLGDDFKN